MGLDSSPLDAFRVWPAYIACHLVGPPGPWRRSRRPSILLREDPRGTADESGRLTLQVVSDTYRDGTVGFKYLDFGAAPGSCTVLAELDARSSGRIQVYIDEPYAGPLIATLPVPAPRSARDGRPSRQKRPPSLGRTPCSWYSSWITARSVTSPSSPSGEKKKAPQPGSQGGRLGNERDVRPHVTLWA
jgi:hypothetical protein